MFRSNLTPKTPDNNVTQILWPSLFLDEEIRLMKKMILIKKLLSC